MAISQVTLEYTIHLTDKALVEELQQGSPWAHSPYENASNASDNFNQLSSPIYNTPGQKGNVIGGPASAALKWGAPVIQAGAQFSSPCITSPWITTVNQLSLPIDRDKFLTVNAVFTLLGLTPPVDESQVHTSYFRWVGKFAYAPPGGLTQNGDALGTISQRDHVEGFEAPMQGEGSDDAGGNSPYRSRDCSRHADGYGLAIRGQDGVIEHTLAVTRNSRWERFYIRPRQFPSGEVEFWGQHVDGGAFNGVSLAMQSTGRISLKNVDGAGVRTTLVTTDDPLVIDTWYRIDLLLKSGTLAQVKLYIRGALQFTVDTPGGLSGGAGWEFTTSFIGTELNTSARALGLDVDDWVGAALPTTLDGLDWENGSKCKRVEASGFHADNDSNWAGDWAAALQNPADDGSEVLTSSTSGAVLAVTTAAELALDAERQSLGCAALVVGVQSERDGVANGELGYSIAGAAFDMAAITQQNTPNWASRIYAPTGLTNPQDVTPVALKHTKGASTDPSIVYALMAVAELIGVFGPEDVVEGDDDELPDTVKPVIPVHNSPYPTSPWARKSIRPLAPLRITGGTYTGNDSIQTIEFAIPIHWMFVRHVSAANEGWMWFSSLLAPHAGWEKVQSPAAGVYIGFDPDFVPAGGEEDQVTGKTLVRIVGDEARWNASGETYQYVAFADPVMRNLFCRALAYPRGTANKTTNFLNDQFLPVASFFWKEEINGSSDTAAFWQGPGHTGGAVSPLDAAEVASAVDIIRGSLTSKSALHFSGAGAQIPFALFRDDDRSTDPGKINVLSAITYTGDGASPRTIEVSAETDRFPMFAIVQPTTGEGVQRDPSHTGTTSTNGSFASVPANGIRGGDIGSIIVGSDLNANGVVYNVFVLWGLTTGSADGWSDNGDSDPVDPGGFDEPTDDGDWDDEPPDQDPPDEGDDGSGGGSGDPGTGGDDFATGCIGASTQLVNRALAHIGITHRLDDLSTNERVEAEQARLIYADVVDAVLRAFPWPFATKYAQPVLVTGETDDPTNDDWVFAYRVPTDMVFLRRMVKTDEQKGRYVDHVPAAFRIGRDTNGGLIYTNLEDATIEYTFRPTCAATAGDALFRDAMTWLLASEFAPSMARNKVTARECIAMFHLKIAEARTAASNEQQFPDDGHGDAEWIRGRN